MTKALALLVAAAAWTPAAHAQIVVPTQPTTLVNTIATSSFGSPDPAGLSLAADGAGLLLSDSEVDELPDFHPDPNWDGKNIFSLTSRGALLAKLGTAAFSREPAGIEFNPLTATLFISDDDQTKVFEVDSAVSRVISSFSTLSWTDDPEGLGVDPVSGHLFIAGGRARKIIEVTSQGGLVAQFTTQLSNAVQPNGSPLPVDEVNEPESVAFDPVSGHLFVVSGLRKFIYEFTRQGTIVSRIDLRPHKVIAPKSVTLAPSSDPNDAPTVRHFYVGDLGVRAEQDGRILEVALLPPIFEDGFE